MRRPYSRLTTVARGDIRRRERVCRANPEGALPTGSVGFGARPDERLSPSRARGRRSISAEAVICLDANSRGSMTKAARLRRRR